MSGKPDKVTNLPKRPRDKEPLQTAADGKAPPSGTLAHYDFPHQNSKGNLQGTIENLEYLLEGYAISARYNEIAKRLEIAIPGVDGSADNTENVAFAHITSLAAKNGLPRENLADYLRAIGDRRRYNPAREWILSRPWDGQSRLPDFFETLDTADVLRNVLLRRFLVSAVAAACEPSGFWCKGVLVLQGRQDIGKTSWVRRMVPPEVAHLRDDGLHLDPADKDSVLRCVRRWLVELGELETTLRRDIEALKAFITQQTDTIRRPYDRFESSYQRRTVFIATVNSEKFLKDETGNSRFWTIRCRTIDYEHGIDMQQLFREVHDTLYARREPWHLSPAEQEAVDAHNRQLLEESPIQELLTANYDFDAGGSRWISATEVAIEIGYDRPDRSTTTRTGTALRKLNLESKIIRGVTLYRMPTKQFQGERGEPELDL